MQSKLSRIRSERENTPRSLTLKKTDQPPSGKNDTPEVIAQWHADPDEGEMERSPNVELRIKKDQVQIYKVWDDNAKSVESTLNQILLLEFPLKELKGKWTDWVFHIHWDFNKDGKGLLEVWKNKEKILTHNGPMGCNDTKPTSNFNDNKILSKLNLHFFPLKKCVWVTSK